MTNTYCVIWEKNTLPAGLSSIPNQSYSLNNPQGWILGCSSSTTPAWDNSLNAGQSDYFQGEVIPFVIHLTGLTDGNKYAFSLEYNYYHNGSGRNAGGFTSLYTYNLSRNSLHGPAPTTYTSGSVLSEDNAFSGGGLTGSFYTVNANVVNVSAPAFTTADLTAIELSKKVIVTFEYHYDAAKGMPLGQSDIYWGMYLARNGTVTDVGTQPTNGAAHWPGGSLQATATGLAASVADGTSTLTSSLGSVSLNPSGGAIVEGVISGMKYSDLNKDGTKNGSDYGMDTWTINLHNNTDNSNTSVVTSGGGNYSFGNLLPGTYVVTETNKSGWTQTQPGAANSYQYSITISANATTANPDQSGPTHTNRNFGNFQCVEPVVTGTLETCAGRTTQLSGDGTAASTNPWVSDATGVATVDASGLVTGVSGGTANITYTNNLGCTKTVTVTIDGNPTAASVGSTQNICGSLVSSALGGNTPSVGTGAWSVKTKPAGSTINFSDASSGSSTATVSAYGTYVFTWTISNGTCTASTADITVNYNRRSVCASYSGDYFANTESTTTGGTTTVNLVFNVSPGTGSCNSINALQTSDFTISFKDFNSISSAVIVDGTLNYDPTTQKVTAQAIIILGNAAYSGDVTAVLNLTNDNYAFATNCPEQPIITVSTKTNDFVTGGGYIIPSNSSFIGRPGSSGTNNVNGFKNNFGFSVKWNKTMKQLQGNWNTIIRRNETDGVHLYQVKAKPSTLVVRQITGGYRADIVFSSVNFQDLTCGCWSDGGNKSSVNLTVVDYGEPGAGVDRIHILIKDKAGNTWYESNKLTNLAFGNESSLPLLTQGNIQIHTGGNAGGITMRDVQTQTQAPVYELRATPNPTRSYFTVQLPNAINSAVNVRIMDILGRVVEAKQNLAAGQTLRIGSGYKPGVYIVEVTQGTVVKQLKLVKQ